MWHDCPQLLTHPSVVRCDARVISLVDSDLIVIAIAPTRVDELAIGSVLTTNAHIDLLVIESI